MNASDDVRRRTLVLSGAFLAVLTVALLMVATVAVRARMVAEDRFDEVNDLRAVSDELDAAIVDQETGVRGFVITGQEAFLEPYERGGADAAERLDALAVFYANDPAGRAAVDMVEERLDEWRREIATPQIEAVRAGDAASAVALERSGVGRERFDGVRVATDGLRSEVSRTRSDALGQVVDSSTVLLVTVAVVGVAALALTVLFARNFRRWGDQRAAAEAERRRRADADEQERLWVERLAGFSERLNRMESRDAVAMLVTKEAAAVLGAGWVNMALVEASGSLRMIWDPAYASAADAPVIVDVEAEFPMAEAARRNSTVEIGDGPGQQPVEQFTGFVPTAHANGVRSGIAVPLVGVGGRVVGALGALWAEPTSFDTVLHRRVNTLSALTAEAVRRGRLFDVGSATAAISQRLAGALGRDELARIVVDEAGALFDARLATMAIVAPDGRSVRLVHGNLLDPVIAHRYDEIPLAASTPLTDAIRTGRSVTVASLDELDDLYPHLRADTDAAGLRATVSVPVHARGRVQAAIGIGWTYELFADAEEAALTTFAELVSSALHRTALFEAASQVAALAGRLAEASTPDAVADAVLTSAPVVFGAMSARLGLLDDQAGVVHVRAPGELSGDELATMGLDTPNPLVEAIRTDREVLVDGASQITDRYPASIDEAGRQGVLGVLAVPLHDRDDRVTGGLAIGWDRAPQLDPTTRTFVETIAEMTGATLERTGLYALEHELVTHLSEQLLRSDVSVSGVDVAGRYLPALEQLGVGGDWYEFVERKGRMLAVVGDVVGHGVEAAAEMARLRTTISTLLQFGVDVDQLFLSVHPILSVTSDRHDFRGTALCAEIDIADGRVRVSSAGHPPPLLRQHDDDSVVRLTCGRYPPLGIGADTVRASPWFPFRPGDVLVAYTDGLVERRREELDHGIDRLAVRLIAVGDRTADEIADELVDLADDGRDDVALVVVRCDA